MKEQPPRVLIAEDDPLVSRMIQGLLEEIDYQVAARASDGRQAVALTRETQPDVVLMDVRMSKIDGIRAARTILEQCPTPVVILSAYETPELLQEASAAGVGAYLVKPPTARELERAISISIARFDDIVSLRRQNAELAALHQASLTLTSRLELEAVLSALLEQALDLVKASDTHIFFFDGSELTFGAALWANGTQGQPIASPRPNGLTANVARRGEPIVIPNVNDHPLFQEWQWGGAIIGLPLKVGDQVIGVMNIAFQDPRRFEANELRLLESLAAQAAIANHNARLFEPVQRNAAELEERVKERTHELTQANERLKELDRLKTRFINDISHELRTPATNVRLYLELLERGRAERHGQYLAVIKEQTDQMVHLVEDILDFSQLELDRSNLVFSPVDLNLSAQGVIAEVRPRAEAAGLTVSFHPDATLPTVAAESTQVKLVIDILLDNAINYTRAGKIRVRTYQMEKPAMACVEVTDTGRGIPQEDQPHIFERFFRGQGVGSSNIPGTGLGLSIAKEIVELHEGRIDVKSYEGQGSTFTVRLPLGKEEG
jgi:signal transduction histidine kinase/DNA-binding NarL/FixJ family response regulator